MSTQELAPQNNLEVAETIIQQLGGRRFMAMTGVKHFTTDNSCHGRRCHGRRSPSGLHSPHWTRHPPLIPSLYLPAPVALIGAFSSSPKSPVTIVRQSLQAPSGSTRATPTQQNSFPGFRLEI